MISLLRMLRVIATARWRGRLAVHGESVLRFRVTPGDLDINLHMNNGRYLSVMDLGRLDVILRTGIYRPMLRRRWTALVGSETIRFRRSLGPFQRYELRSRLVGWNDKWFFFEHRVMVARELVAFAVVKGLLRGRQGNIAPALALAQAGHRAPSPSLAPAVLGWCDAEASLFETAMLEADRAGT